METKKEIRKRILEKRRALTPDEVHRYSELICRRILESPEYAKAEDLCLYMPIRNEAEVTLLIEPAKTAGKGVWIPKVIGEEMIFNAYDEEKMVEDGPFHIRESASDLVLTPGEDTLIIMPGAVFDGKCNRIGYGGGYYDRFLEKHPECMTMAAAFDLQLVEALPAETHDIRPGSVVTESRRIDR